MKVWSVYYEYQMVGSNLVEANTAEEAKRIIEKRFEEEGRHAQRAVLSGVVGGRKPVRRSIWTERKRKRR